VRAALAAFLASLSLACAAAPAPAQRLARLADETFRGQLDLDPLLETYLQGAGPRQGRLEIEFSREHRARERAFHRRTLARAKAIPAAGLDESQRITRELLVYNARTRLEAIDLPIEVHGLLTQSWRGIANQLVFLIDLQPFRDAADYRAWFARLRRYPALLAAARVELEGARRAGITTPAVLVRAALGQWDAIVPDDGDPARSSLWKPIARMPADIDAAARGRIEGEYRALLRDEILPAMGAFAAYVREEYLPRARTSDGIGALPGGERMYRILVREQTTTALTPDEIHELGLKEVRRIQTQLILVAAQAGFQGEMRDFGGWIASRPQNYPFTSGEEVLQYLRETLATRIEPQLPRLFSRVPRARFEIRLTEPELAATSSANYAQPSSDGTRPGVFRIPVVDPRRQPMYGLRSLLAHEGMPGHHFDHGFAAELDVPQFRRNFRTVAFGEGWGLYAESLGHEMNLYDEPYSLMGRYAAELFRAARLVVDTGLHARGWSRERAIRYLMEEAGSPASQATSEIQRYMANPGQALGYKVGELTILELRAEAERRLGDRFDIRAFHDAVLGQGHLPLSMLRARIGAWIASRLAGVP
jgi:uncharacterized protein (DUF885 family)